MAPINHRDNLAQHMHISSADDLSYSVSPSSGINDTIHTIVTGRKCWKTMKGKGEVVWPPYLEAALVEGLEKYQPVESRTSRSFGRFPMRNKFISDYIFNVTGKRRTPKQVGSRLQQLRDTTEGKRILQQLSSKHLAMMQPKSAQAQSSSEASSDRPSTASSSSSSSTPAPSTTLSRSASTSTPAPVNRTPSSFVCIDVIPDPGMPLPPLRLPSLGGMSLGAPTATPSTLANFVPSPTSSPSGMGLGLNSSGPRVLRHIDPSVTFMSRAPLAAYSSFKVSKNGAGHIHTESTELEMLSSSCMPMPQWPSEMECTFLYRTQFVPRFWETLCRSADPSVFTITQEIVRTGAAEQYTPEDVLLSILFQFNNVSATPPLSPDSATFSDTVSRPGTAGSQFSSTSTSDLSSDLDDIMMFNYPLDVPSMHTSMSGGLPPIHTAADIKHTMPPALIHADEDAYSSLPPTPTSPLELSAAHLGWHNTLTGAQGDCGQSMYGLSASMSAAVGLGPGDVAIAGSGQFMGVSGSRFTACGLRG
ncbi:TEA/ATTS domain family-domain-containing protein [Trametes gibbosa]|nr:TEA/ATTS domain family-domain-containing protein [Trametes gibbosa]